MTKRLINEINVYEVSQYGDVFMVRFDCFNCRSEMFSGFEVKQCTECMISYEGTPRIFKKSFRRIIVGSSRKHGSIKKKLIQQMFSMQEGRCFYCAYDITFGYHVEHMVPLAVGGTNKPSNLCLSCPRCNLVAGSKYFDTEQAKRKYIMENR